MLQLLHCLEKLHELQVLVTHLQATGIGRTVNALRKKPGPVGEAARKLVARWKQIVEAHVSSEDEGGDHVSSTRKGKKTLIYLINLTLIIKMLM
jgi:transcription elongation factor B polypeptide 3